MEAYPSRDHGPENLAQFGAALARVDACVDWRLLGQTYCDGGGEDFFTDEAREANVDAALMFAAELGEHLRPGGASLYVGAGVAELPLLVFEAIMLDRRVHAVTLDGFEPQELNRALAAAAEEIGRELPHFGVDGLAALEGTGDTLDHLWLVSVLTDPDAFPALHDTLYERRTEADGATGRGRLAEDRERARALVEEALDRLAPGPALVSTTDEEWTLVGPALGRRGRAVEVPSRGRLSAIVGDVVRHVPVAAMDRTRGAG